MQTNPAQLFPSHSPNAPLPLTDFYLLSSDQSERHARIEKKDSSYLLRDLRSGFPTFVNHTQVHEATLHEGDCIRVGTMSYVFSYESTLSRKSWKLVSKNDKWNMELDLLANVAKTNYPVLILGPSGTGKEVIASSLHKHSARSQKPFISVNCSALTETLVESELFGHIKGSFTGAINDRKGAFEAARGGTLFLDEIGDLSYSLQAKLLRALENGEIRPVGSDTTIKTDVRIIAATHQNLLEKIQAREFRSDLYFRLNVVTASPPPLVERLEDFEDLLYHFSKEMKVRFSHNAIQRLKRHSWPGNIRELKNTVARASALFPRQQIDETKVEKIIDPLTARTDCHGNLLATQAFTSPAPMPVIKEIEKQMIIKRLIANKGNQRKTASDLGLPKSTLHDRLSAYKINPKSYLKD